jgi:GNAT superfamily N-acetyltransferase
MKYDVISGNDTNFIKRFTQLSDKINPDSRGKYSSPSSAIEKLIHEMSSVERKFFIAQINEHDVARVAVMKSSDNKIFYFGFFDVDLSVENPMKITTTLMGQVEQWAKERGAQEILGPIDFNTWFGNRFKNKKSAYHFSWEPQNPIEYVDLFLKNNFEVTQEYISVIYDDSAISFERTKSAYEQALGEGYTFRVVDPEKKDEPSKLYTLNVASFSQTYLYQPISQETYEKMILQNVPTHKFKHSFFISDKNGKELGYLFAFIENNFLIVKSLLIHPSVQGARLSSALIHRSMIEARNDGFFPAVGAMVRRGNKSELFFKHLQEPVEINTYVMLSKKVNDE